MKTTWTIDESGLMAKKQQELFLKIREWKLNNVKFSRTVLAKAVGTEPGNVTYWLEMLERWGWVSIQHDHYCGKWSDRITITRPLLYPELEEAYELEKQHSARLEAELARLREMVGQESKAA